MKKIKTFFNKYGIIIHTATLVLWISILKENYNKFQIEPTTSIKTSLIITVVLIVLSTFNLIMALKRLKK